MKPEILERYKRLIENLNKWNNEYYNLDTPSVTDEVYDQEYQELLEIESMYPEAILENSPSQIIGGFASNKFSKYKHNKPMLSLNKANINSEIEKFYQDIFKVVTDQNKGFFLEPKVDGLSISLHYNNGKLVRAVTRGDGVFGEDVTENILQIKSVKLKIDFLEEIEIRGEVYLSKKNFEKLNKTFLENDQKLFANPRNAAAGTLRQLDKKIVKQRNLDVVLYEIVQPENYNISTQEDAIKFIKNLGLNTQKNNQLLFELSDILKAVNDFETMKNTLEYECDGLVIKYNDFTKWNLLGFTSKFPKYAIAYKYKAEQAITTIRQIDVSVGRTGKINYVANVEPVSLNQSTVSKATLHNYDYIRDLNLNINDEVVIIKAGEIIPKVISLHKKNSLNSFEKVLNCPSCKSVLETIDGNVDQYCLNLNCEEKIINSIIYFASKPCLDINGLGDKIVKILYENNIIKNIQDIYLLNNKVEEIAKLRSFKDKKIENLLTSVEQSKGASISKVLSSLGIKNIGARASKLIAKKIDKLEDLYYLNLNDLEDIADIGPKSVESIKLYLENESNKELIMFLDNIFTYAHDKKANNEGKLNLLSFSITGKLEHERNYYISAIEQNGGEFHTVPTKQTSYLIVGLNAGDSKLNKALKNGTKLLTLKEFDKLIN
ncbi:NAD-dependent DNA ligase LigA [Mycoplasmopsis alligatoris]|uniref:DNA ligase n=1 Tax=Mycoplasmopsis alligatoris A21JP2 TaxID=747682 RepID=D4XVG7_9BACT|nr:NAD-dependent DNA ligase LigA [Mycoplasmopsis alligatoris]EFF41677.1 DNA ligase (NAD(+)) [Mycoplasmopsis alligatoris A21JP2]